MTDEFRVASIDPGLASGVAVVEFGGPDNCSLVVSDELEFAAVKGWCEEWFGKADRLVMERFIINQRTIKNTQAPWSLMVIGVGTAIAMEEDMPVFMQSAAEGKGMVDNAMLHRLGLWHRGGEGHANDAIRHAVAHAIRQKWRDPRLLPEDA